jgi:serine/threonine-protein kinase
VVDVYDINMDPDGCFMVMELLEGESLDARLKREGSLGVAVASEILYACLSGVAAAHAAGVIHRDLKPANIFLCQTSEPGRCHPKVLDFGISRTLPEAGASTESNETRKGTLIGTPAYMAPEQLRGATCDVRTDIYALGVTLYEMLSGQRAYDAPTYADLIVRVVSGDAEPLEQVVPQLPHALCDCVMRAMDRDPKQRFASVAELAQHLEPYIVPSAPSLRHSLQSLPLTAAAYPRASWSRKHLVLGGVALGLALTGILWLRAPQAGELHRVLPAPVSDPAAETQASESTQSPAIDPANHDSAPPTAPNAASAASNVPPKRANARAPTRADHTPPKAAAKRAVPQPRVSSAGPEAPAKPGPRAPSEAPERKPKPQPPLTEF